MKEKILARIRVALLAIFLGLLTRILIALLVFVGVFSWFPLLIARRVRVRGRKNLWGLPKRNVLIVANHPSYLEPFFIPFALCWPQVLLFSYQAMRQAADMHNLRMDKPVLGFILSLFCVPVNRRESREAVAFYPLVQRLLSGRVLLFPTGGRESKAEARDELLGYTANGAPIGMPKDGVGELIVRNGDSLVLPIFVRGTEKVAPVGSNLRDWIKNIWKYKVEIIIGKPIRPDHNMRYARGLARSLYAQYVMRCVMELDVFKEEKVRTWRDILKIGT
jgi:1-acyl-sn-glycerol-3-phosphate acyltransferase